MFGRLLQSAKRALSPSLLATGAFGASAYAAYQLEWLKAVPAQAEEAKSEGALNPNEWRSFKVTKKWPVTHDTQGFRFGFADANQESGLHVASCLMTRAPIGSQKEDGTKKFVIRPYTPATEPDAKGYLDLVIKAYPQGKMSQHIHGLEVGDSLEIKGPMSKLPYTPNMKEKIGMIAGGSGLTPMLQIAQEVVRNPEDKTEVTLVFANKSEDDILLKKELDDMARKHKNFHVYYVVDKPSSWFWRGGKGHIDADMVKQQLPPPSDKNLILVCGPPPMMKALSGDKAEDKSQGPLTGVLKDVGFTESQVFKF
ncbi:g11674 [Coccomyxa viridis]|uniref:NADH-cytochrome b5 reductase n=1 Tax=Coccomyxa viridis TaxID=1274662 RepID=A0ABP1G8T8_9CHLO